MDQPPSLGRRRLFSCNSLREKIKIYTQLGNNFILITDPRHSIALCRSYKNQNGLSCRAKLITTQTTVDREI